MSSFEEKLLEMEIPKNKYNDLTSKERQVLYDLKIHKNIVIEGSDQGL